MIHRNGSSRFNDRSSPIIRSPLRLAARVALAVLMTSSAWRASSAQPAPAATTPSSASQQYSIMIWEAPSQIAARTDSKAAASYWKAFADFGELLQQAGVLRGGSALKTGADVRTVTVRGGKTQNVWHARLQGTEELGGYFVIETLSLDEAVKWAARIPAALTGTVELRPAYPAPTMTKIR